MRISGLVTQRGAPSWGLGRVSHRQAGSRDYVFDDSAGRGVTIYGVDTGIDINHQDFRGRARWGTNTADRDNADRHGHGTHTASTFAGTAYGIAKNANIVAVKVLGSDGSGSTSGIIAGINYCVQDAQQRGILGKAAMNLSLGGGFSQANNDAVTRAQNAGIFVAVAAGNDNVSLTYVVAAWYFIMLKILTILPLYRETPVTTPLPLLQLSAPSLLPPSTTANPPSPTGAQSVCFFLIMPSKAKG